MDQFEHSENNSISSAEQESPAAEKAPITEEESIFGEKSFKQAPPPPQYNNTPYGNMQYGNTQYGNAHYSAPQNAAYHEYYPNGGTQYNNCPPQYGYGAPQYGAPQYYAPYQQNNGYYNAYSNNIPQPQPEIPAAPVEAASEKKVSKGWIIALVISMVLALSAVMVLLALANKDKTDNPDTPAAESIFTPSAGNSSGSGVTVNIAVQPKPIEGDEYYQDKKTGLLTTAGAAKQALPSVVSLYGYQDTILTYYTEASGIIISEDGYIITNAHFTEDVKRVKVRLSDDREFEAQITGTDPQTDLAVLKIEADNLTPAVLGNPDDLMQGEQVIAIGNAGGYNNSVSVGYVSHTSRVIQSYKGGDIECIQTDAVLNFGNSGGALVNLYGQVVGVVTSKYSSTGEEKIGFAIRSDFAADICEDIIANGYVTARPRVGITYLLVTPEMAAELEVVPGMLIDTIDDSCDISNTQLEKDDIITELDGIQILSTADLEKFQKEHKPGDTVTAKVYRKDLAGNITEFEITFKLENSISQ